MKIGMKIYFSNISKFNNKEVLMCLTVCYYSVITHCLTVCSYYSVLFPGRINGLVSLYLGIGISETRVNIKSIMI